MSENRITGAVSKQDAHDRQLPQRSCVGCRQVRDKRQLVRLVRLADGNIEVDISGKKPGRGAYLCPSPGCWQEGLKKDRLAHALHTTISKEKRTYLLEYGQSLNDEKISMQPVSLVS
jgi:predicted RNA-binding protein YlxR (DUF448 family)